MLKQLQKLKNHQGFKRYGSNAIWLLTEKVTRMVFGLFIGVWIARYLGPSDFGTLNYVLSYVALFGVIGTFGLDGIIIRELVKDKTKHNVILGTSFILRIIGTFIVLALILLTIPLTNNTQTTELYMLIIIIAGFFNATIIIDYFFKSEVKSKNTVIVNIVALSISGILKILLILFKLPLIAFFILFVIDNIVLAIGYIFIYSTYGNKISNWKFNTHIAYKLLKNSWPLMISGMMVTIYSKSDILMIQEFLDSSAVGIYAAATRISIAWYFIPSIIGSSLFPALINAKKTSEILYYSRLQKLLTFMIFTGLLIAIPMTFLSDWIIVLLYGDIYKQAGLILSIHIWAAVFVFISSAVNQWIVNENLQIISMVYTAIGAILNILLNYFLIPVYGIVGASIATVISYFLVSIICPLCHFKTRKIFFVLLKSINIFNLIKHKGHI